MKMDNIVVDGKSLEIVNTETVLSMMISEPHTWIYSLDIAWQSYILLFGIIALDRFQPFEKDPS